MMRNNSSSIISSLQMDYGGVSDEEESDSKNTSRSNLEEEQVTVKTEVKVELDEASADTKVTPVSDTEKALSDINKDFKKEVEESVLDDVTRSTNEETQDIKPEREISPAELISDDEDGDTSRDSSQPSRHHHHHHHYHHYSQKVAVAEAVNTDSPSSQGSLKAGRKATRLVSYGPDEDVDEDESSSEEEEVQEPSVENSPELNSADALFSATAMAAPCDFYKGRVFKNYDEFKKLWDQHCASRSEVYVLKNASRVEWKNKRATSSKAHYPLDWQYVNFELRCKHFGTYTSTSTGKRKHQETFKTGCTSAIRLSANKKKNGLVIKRVNLNHTGHSNVETVNDAMVYPEMRRLNSSQLDDVKKMLSLRVPTAKIIQHIRETSGIILSAQDLANKRRQLKKDLKTEEILTRDLFQELTTKDPGAAVEIVVDKNSKETSFIFFQTSDMKNYLKRYPSVIFLDATYKVSNGHMPLFSFMCVDGDHCGQVVAYGLVVNETMNVISDLINCFLSHNSHVKEQTSTFVVGKDFSEIQSLKLALPSVNIVLCKWHVEKTVRGSLKDYCQSDRKQILELVVKMLTCDLESEYYQLVSQLVSGFPSYEAYFRDNWHCCRESWAGCFVRKLCTYGNLTKNIVESHNHKIKFLVSHFSSVPMLLKELLAFHEAKSCSSEIKKSKLSFKKKNIHSSVPLPSDVVTSIYQWCAPYGAKIITQQLEISCEKSHLVNDFEVVDPNGHTYYIENGKCNCFVSRSQQLVCSHLFSFRRENGYPLFQESDVPNQHKLATFLSKRKEPDQPNSCFNFQASQQPPTSRILNQNEKYRKADRLFSEISSVMSGLAQQEFDAYFDMFKGIVDAIKQGKNVIYFVGDAVATTQSSVLNNTVQSSVLDSVVSNEIESDVAIDQSSVLNNTVQSSVLDSVVSNEIKSDVATDQSPVLDNHSSVFGFPLCPPSPVSMSVPSSTLSDTLPSNEVLINQTQASSSSRIVFPLSSLSTYDDEFKFPTKTTKRGRPKENDELKSFKRKKI